MNSQKPWMSLPPVAMRGVPADQKTAVVVVEVPVPVALLVVIQPPVVIDLTVVEVTEVMVNMAPVVSHGWRGEVEAVEAEGLPFVETEPYISTANAFGDA